MIVDSVTSRDMMDRFANLPDRDIKRIAYKQAATSVEDKKHKRIDNAIFYSIPLAAGVAAAAKKAPRIGRVGNFVFGAMSWALPFLAVDTVAAVKNKIEKHSKAARNFNEKQPVVSMLATLGLSLAGYSALMRGGSKYIIKNEEKILSKFGPLVDKLSKGLESSKVLNKASELTAKVPSSVKDISKSILDFGPWALLLSSLTHTITHNSAKTKEYVTNYNNLKEQQSAVREALSRDEEV